MGSPLLLYAHKTTMCSSMKLLGSFPNGIYRIN
jgi:hypothetical protein